MTRPKFKVGDVVAWRNDRRFHERIRGRRWDPHYPGWRYQIERKMSTRLKRAGYSEWSIIETEFVPVQKASGRRNSKKGVRISPAKCRD